MNYPQKMDSSNVVDKNQPNNGTKNNSVPIRTVCVVGGSSNMIGEIRGHFGRFGEIESVAVRFVDFNYWHYLVQFKRKADAKRALLSKERKWNIFEVTAADPLNQPDHPLQVPPEQDSGSNILVALNDHCLQEVFNNLKLRDLTNAAEVCIRFNEHAKILFASQHKHLDLNREFDLSQLGLVEIAMKHFGKDIQSLAVHSVFFKPEAEAIHMISQNCGPKLKRLDLSGFQFQSDWSACHSIFAGIEQLELFGCYESIGLGQLLAACVELKSLTSCGWNNDNACVMKQKFPKLQELSLVYTRVSDEQFEGFIIRHPTLTKLTIQDSHTPRALRTIGRHAKNLQELMFVRSIHSDDDNQFQNDVAFIGQLHSLKKLKIDFFPHQIDLVLKALIVGEVPIESMDISVLWRRSDDDAIKYILQLKRIKTLRMNIRVRDRRLTDADIIELAKNLADLEELYLGEYYADRVWGHDFKSELSTIGLRKMLMHSPKLKLLGLQSFSNKIDIDDYKVMLGTVQQRKEKAALLIKIHRRGGYRSQVDVPAATLTENRKTINIQEFRF